MSTVDDLAILKGWLANTRPNFPSEGQRSAYRLIVTIVEDDLRAAAAARDTFDDKALHNCQGVLGEIRCALGNRPVGVDLAAEVREAVERAGTVPALEETVRRLFTERTFLENKIREHLEGGDRADVVALLEERGREITAFDRDLAAMRAVTTERDAEFAAMRLAHANQLDDLRKELRAAADEIVALRKRPTEMALLEQCHATERLIADMQVEIDALRTERDAARSGVATWSGVVSSIREQLGLAFGADIRIAIHDLIESRDHYKGELARAGREIAKLRESLESAETRRDEAVTDALGTCSRLVTEQYLHGETRDRQQALARALDKLRAEYASLASSAASLTSGLTDHMWSMSIDLDATRRERNRYREIGGELGNEWRGAVRRLETVTAEAHGPRTVPLGVAESKCRVERLLEELGR